jgi:DNA invertase Pin-like site-specific DNA recombinase
MFVGYARISTIDQNLDMQKDALERAGCTKIFTETASGAKVDRPILRDALGYVRDGDVLVVWKLDRLGRSLKQLIETVTELQERGIEFKSLTENIDTTTSAGKPPVPVSSSSISSAPSLSLSVTLLESEPELVW